MSSGSPPTLWCDLIFAATPLGAARLDHVGVERALDEEARRRRASRASSSKTRMNSSPTIAALLLGVGRRPRAARGSAPAASTWTSGTWKWPSKVSTTCAASSLRSRPWSTKTQVSWSPTALWTSSAATAESTPPESAQMTRSRADLRADALDLLLDHGGGRPRRRRAGDVVEEVLQQLLAVRRVHDLRVELDAVEAALRRPRRRRSASTREPAVTRAPSGGASTESRWLIQTVCSSGRPAASAPRRRASAVLPNSRRRCARRGRRGPAPSAACRSRCRAPGRRARRAPGRPAARPRRRPRPARRRGHARPGSSRADRVGRSRVRDELRVDARLADAAGDQLRVLAAEVDDEHGPLLRSGSGEPGTAAPQRR